jgi:2-methylcitrate dehydratase PrpD
LHLSQPAVTAHLRRLEEIVGKPLVSRSTRGIRLTTHGHALRILSAEIQNGPADFSAKYGLAVAVAMAPASRASLAFWDIAVPGQR